MKLTSLKVAGLRGFNEERTLDFDGVLVIYSGPNGAGKTSIGESIEWLFYGKTLKRIKGDEISKREYADSYRNTHYHGPVNPFVEAEIIDVTGKPRRIRRDLEIDESSILTVDGVPCTDLHEFGISGLYDRPLILQHTLQDFIFMRPKTRYEVLSSMLGLEPLVEFRNAVEMARTDFQNRLPQRAVDARNRAGLLLGSFARFTLLQPVSEAAARRQLGDAHKHLVNVAMGRVSAGTSEINLVSTLRQIKGEKERAKLDWGRLSIAAISKPQVHPSLAGLENLRKALSGLTEAVAEALSVTASTNRDAIDPALRNFLTLGLGLMKSGVPQQCPFCLEDTLTPARIAEIRHAVDPLPQARIPVEKARKAADEMLRNLPNHWKQALRLVPQLPSAGEHGTIAELARESPGALSAYVESCGTVGAAAAALEQARSSFQSSLEATRDALVGGQSDFSGVASVKDALEDYEEQITQAILATNVYAATYSALDPGIKMRLASEEDIRFLQLLIDGLTWWKDLEIAQKTDEILEAMQELIRRNRSFIDVKQRQTLGVRDHEIKSWYQLLSGSAEVGYGSIIPGTDNLELRARSFAKVMMAAPNLSCSQLNCVGLAVYLSTCCRKGSPFKLILFDDPIQSMDDDHTESFKKDVISSLLGRGFQVILLTHMENFADGVEQLYRSVIPLFYKLEPYVESGPCVIWNGPELKRLLRDVEKNKDAPNSGYRKQAVLGLRQVVERFVKDVFVAERGKPISKKYENESWPKLRDLLRQCTAFDSNDEPQLEDTHDFTSPYLHTDNSLPQKVPAPHQLAPHYESMRKLLDKYAHLLQMNQ